MDVPELESSLVPGSDRVYYLSNFITEDEERYLIRKVIISAHLSRTIVSASCFFILVCANVYVATMHDLQILSL
jgi:hypothetical protein